MIEGEIKHPKWTEWLNKTEEESEQMAQENGWGWYFDWFDVGDSLRYKYEQADKDPQVANKYNRYDRFYDEHRTESSSVFLGIDGSFHESDKPIHKWTVYADCTKYECPYNKGEDEKGHHRCSYFYDDSRMPDCFNDLFASIQAIKDVTGDLSVIKRDLNIHKDIIGWFEYGDKYFKEMKTMSKPFWVALSELKTEDKISVYWEDGMMYVNDESDGQATENVSFFQAYKFAVLINATIFDYTASDEEVKQLGKELLNLIDEDERAVNIWEYFDDISEDFEKLTGIKIDIDQKRAIVSDMTEMGEDGYNLMCGFGSVSFIAKMLWNYIKGDNKLYQNCNNPTANELADKYLQTDDYDIIKFAEELHKECQYKMTIPTDFDEYLFQSSRISFKCYELLEYLLENNIDYKQQFLVGYIDWFGDYRENERYIYCHIDSNKNEIYFQENRNAPKSAYLHDIAFPHLVADPNRIQKDIEIKFTEQYIEDIMNNEFNFTIEKRGGYTHCHMYGTVGTYTK